MSTAEISHIAYRTIDGRRYVLVSHAEAELIAAIDDTLDAAAKFTEGWLKGRDDGLADALRAQMTSSVSPSR